MSSFNPYGDGFRHAQKLEFKKIKKILDVLKQIEKRPDEAKVLAHCALFKHYESEFRSHRKECLK